MKAISEMMNKWMIACLFILSSPVFVFAQHLTLEEEAAQSKRTELYGEVGIGVIFAVAVTLFLIFKAKHDKKQREKQLKQMQQIQANKRRAA